ncbi:hypothetical protein EYF80_007319 [Liparis tanakae]|uniref:Uncharacterized protein n=1 Tax=Liparis tanakae TaxID=230148 RepID=A0A4Z2IY85_9TELE|nr:hypothetical protein EYF80_007319 [Liparis tanakae]
MYTNSTAADGTTLLWYDCCDWYCKIFANSGSGVVCCGRVGGGLANPPGPMGFNSDVITP